MKSLMDELGRNLSCPATLGRILQRACNDGSIAQHVNGLLEKMTGGDESHLSLANARGLLLARDGDSILQVRRIGGAQTFVDKFSDAHRYVHTPPSNCVMVIQESSPVTVHRYRLPAGLDRSDFRIDIPIERLDSEPYDGAPIAETPADELIREYECPIGQAWMIRFNYPPYDMESWFFDKASLRSAFATAVLPETSTLVTLCRVFAATHDEKARPLVEELARHDAHFVRWAAVQAMGQIDGDRARELIAQSCTDSHPHVRAAAQRTLERLGGS